MNARPVTATSIKMIASITSYENEQLCGTLDSIYFKEPLIFNSLVDMIEMMETTYDALGFPDKAFLPRTFKKAQERIRKREDNLEKLLARHAGGVAGDANAGGAIATFEIFVGFRNNAEWQGKLRWADRDVTKEFASIVELVRLIDEAVSGK